MLIDWLRLPTELKIVRRKVTTAEAKKKVVARESDHAGLLKRFEAS